MPKKKLNFFISYSHEDKRYKTELLKHLKTLELTHSIEVWHDGKITAGEEIDSSVLKNLNSSDVVLLLISPNFLASWYCIKVELEKAIERHRQNKSIVVPVIISKCEIDQSLSFSRLMRVPEDGNPIRNFKPQNDGYVDAVKRIKEMINEKFINSKRSSVKEPKVPISFDLYQHGKKTPYIIDDNTWMVIQTIKDRISSFDKIMMEKLIDFIFDYKVDFSKAKKVANLTKFRQDKLKSFLMEISIATREWLFKEVGVRVHFRVLNKNKNKYVGYIVVDGKAKKDINCNWAKKITPMSTTSGMIYHSAELDAPLIKSKNEEFHERGEHDDIYVDYITSALKLKDMYNTANPLMSMGISIEKDFNKKYAPYLIALAFLKFDVTVENYITLLCTKVKKFDKDFELSRII